MYDKNPPENGGFVSNLKSFTLYASWVKKDDLAAFIENDCTYTPIRFISEELGAGVEWPE